MFSRITRTVRSSLLICALALLLLVGICALALPWHGASSAFAAILQPTWFTCKQSPSTDHCDNQNPEKQGCAASAQTTAHTLIVFQGNTIGRVERRYSSKCKSWWGRVYSYNSHLQGKFEIKIVNAGDPNGSFAGYDISGPPQFKNSVYTIFYSDMEFDAVSTQNAPEIVGILPSSNGSDSGPSATIPSDPAPAK